MIQKQVESIELIDGYPAEVILRRSAELKCDLIIHWRARARLFPDLPRHRRETCACAGLPIPTLVVPYRGDEANS